jgi:hypothetical protein
MSPLRQARALRWAARKPLGNGMAPPDVLRCLSLGLVTPAHVVDQGRIEGWWWTLTPRGRARLRSIRRSCPLARARLPRRGRHRLA